MTPRQSDTTSGRRVGAEAAGYAKLTAAEKQGVISHAKARRKRRAASKAEQKEDERSDEESRKWRAEARAAMKQQQAAADAVVAPEHPEHPEPRTRRLSARQRLRNAAMAVLGPDSPGLAVTPSSSEELTFTDRYDRMFIAAFAAVSICLVAVCVVAVCVAFF